jgi:hypothetical protein
MTRYEIVARHRSGHKLLIGLHSTQIASRFIGRRAAALA